MRNCHVSKLYNLTLSSFQYAEAARVSFLTLKTNHTRKMWSTRQIIPHMAYSSYLWHQNNLINPSKQLKTASFHGHVGVLFRSQSLSCHEKRTKRTGHGNIRVGDSWDHVDSGSRYSSTILRQVLCFFFSSFIPYTMFCVSKECCGDYSSTKEEVVN